MDQTSFVFVTALTGMHLSEPLGKGDSFLNEFFVTNDASTVRKLLSSAFRDAVGGIEYDSISKAPLLIYAKGEVSRAWSHEWSVRFLNHHLVLRNIFLQTLWLVKDNSVNSELGFLESSHSGSRTVTSNFIGGVITKASGRIEVTSFSRGELRCARELLTDRLSHLLLSRDNSDDGLDHTHFTATVVSRPESARFTRCWSFLFLARTSSDLGLKIAMYCSCFEVLFSTDASEIVHKISERVACFLGKDLAERKELFRVVKKAYDIRSKVIHGDIIGQKIVHDLATLSERIDDLLRKIITKIISSPETLARLEAGKDELQEFFLDLVMDDTNPPQPN